MIMDIIEETVSAIWDVVKRILIVVPMIIFFFVMYLMWVIEPIYDPELFIVVDNFLDKKVKNLIKWAES